MLEQQQASEELHSQYAPTPSANHSATLTLTPHAHALVAGYVAQIEAEQQNVTRLRLEELVAAYLELDAEPEQAARSAIQQIEAERLAAETRQATATRQAFRQRKRSRRAKQSARPATLTALKLFAPGALGMIAALMVLAATFKFEDGPIWWTAALCFVLFALPALLGAGVGLRARHRRMLGTFLAMGMLIPLVSLVGGLALSLQAPVGERTDIFWFVACILTLFWLPIGVALAGLTGWARDAFAKAIETQSAHQRD